MDFLNPAFSILEATGPKGRPHLFRRLRRSVGITLVLLATLIGTDPVFAASRIKDIVTFEGVRDNLLAVLEATPLPRQARPGARAEPRAFAWPQP